MDCKFLHETRKRWLLRACDLPTMQRCEREWVTRRVRLRLGDTTCVS
jgi:hypothetical protein